MELESNMLSQVESNMQNMLKTQQSTFVFFSSLIDYIVAGYQLQWEHCFGDEGELGDMFRGTRCKPGKWGQNLEKKLTFI